MKTYPKLTAEIFDLPNCPEWAVAAAVDAGGMCYVYDTTEVFAYENDACFKSAGGFFHGMGMYDASDWKNSLIIKQEKLS